MTVARYMVRRQESGEYSVYDTKTDKPAEVDGKLCINLKFNEALDHADSLNKPQNSN
jgi:hypothetical protein